MVLNRRWPATFAALVFTLPLVAGSLPDAVDREVDFVVDVQPILSSHCYSCHGPEKQKAKLRLDDPAAILRGGESGEPLFVRKASRESHLIKLVAGLDPDEVMPPKGERLSAGEIGILRAWIDQGAKLPGGEAVDAALLKTDHWSLQPVRRPQPPEARQEHHRNPIDQFILEGLTAQGLKPSGPADRPTLIRRLYLVMLGLPPSLDEVAGFEGDTRADAYERLVDRVLESPHYGERWARHWLDVVRYADSNGFETNRERKNAYHYRDYVIRAFNEDKPYDRFVREQLAGDAMGVDVATGFLVAGPYDIVKSPDPALTLKQRQDELADMVNTTGTAFLGLTLGCAQCHNHKFDPVLQKDFYSLEAVFAGVSYGDRRLKKRLDQRGEARVAELRSRVMGQTAALDRLREKAAVGGAGEGTLRPAVSPLRNVETFEVVETGSVRFTIEATSSSEPCIDELEIFTPAGENVALASLGSKASASGTLAGYPIHQLEHLNDGRFGNNHSWIGNSGGQAWVRIDFPEPKRIDRLVWARDRNGAFSDRVATRYRIEAAGELGQWTRVAGSDGRAPFSGGSDPDAFLARLTKTDAEEARGLQKSIGELEAEMARLTEGTSMWVGNFTQPGPTHRLYRGDPFQKREEVAPDALTVLGSLGLPKDAPERDRRVRLAEWIARPENPLTARVMVNRLWQYVFGVGIVATASDFGGNGVAPSHPALLDWLADEFVQSGWSIKHMQRLILNSHTFRQSGFPDEQGLARDAAGLHLWRFPPRRLEGEAIRDSILAASGALDRTVGGPGFYLHDVQVENVMHYFPKEKFGADAFRRMVYLFKIRQEPDAIFGSFDCPDGNQVVPRRSRSNTPLQALNLFNSHFVLQQAGMLAERLRKEAGDAPEAQARRAFRICYAREADAEEREMSGEMIRSEGLEAFCRALYNSSEFLFVF